MSELHTWVCPFSGDENTGRWCLSYSNERFTVRKFWDYGTGGRVFGG